MLINGLVFEDAGVWLADIPAVDLMVQGSSFDDAFEQIQAVFAEELAHVDCDFIWTNEAAGVFSIKLKKPGQILHEIIKRQRQASEISIAAAARRMKKMTTEQWTQIESGVMQATAAQYFSMLDCLDLDLFFSFRKRPTQDS
ncbi:MAG: hypothetical protein HRU19_19595 [Pseudobacteriovorax sp.]|nr:hypothetical protein [Pseudobacteriovorax sp.]